MPRNPSVVQLGGKATVTCLHNRAKRSHMEQEYDFQIELPYICICCENLFIVSKREDDGNPICSTCRGK